MDFENQTTNSLDSTASYQKRVSVAQLWADPQVKALMISSALVLLCLLWLYWGTLVWLVQMWRFDEYYSHGPLLPLISGYLIWQKQDALLEAWRARPARGRIPWLMLAGILIHIIGVLADVRTIQALSIPVVLLGIARFLGGKAFERELRFPCLYLLLAVPLDFAITDHFTYPMQENGARFSSVILGLIGIHVDRVGVSLYTSHYSFEIAAGCSGLKTAITLLTLGILVAHLLPGLTQAQRWVLCALCLPIALVANTMRIVAIVLLGHFFGMKVAEGFLHGFSGIFMFVIAIGLLIAIGTMMGRQQAIGEVELTP